MSWSSGSELMDEVISTIKSHVKDVSNRQSIYVELIEAFRNADWDGYSECAGNDPAFDAALEELGLTEEEEEYDEE